MDAVLDNGTQQLVYELLKLVMGLVGLVTTYYVNKWLNTNATAKKYELDKIITEKAVEDAVVYAEKKGMEYGLKGIKKKELSLKYLDDVNPELISKYGDKLDVIIDRKVAERLAKI